MLTPINFGIFPGIISFTCGYTIKQIKKIYNGQGCKDWTAALKDVELVDSCLGMAMHRIHKGSNYWYCILRDPFTFTDQEMVTLSHEVLHLVQFRLNGVLDRDREFECEAYLHTHIMTQILDQLRIYEAENEKERKFGIKKLK